MLFLAWGHALLFGRAKGATWECASKRQSHEGPRKGAPFSPPSTVVGSPRVPIVHVLFTISPKWRACFQAILFLIRQSFESEPHQDSPLCFQGGQIILLFFVVSSSPTIIIVSYYYYYHYYYQDTTALHFWQSLAATLCRCKEEDVSVI